MVFVLVFSGDCCDWKKKKKIFVVMVWFYVGFVINYILIFKILIVLVFGMS